MSANGCFCKNGSYHNEKPVYQHGTTYVFWSANRWIMSDSVTDDDAQWLYYADLLEYYPTNDGNQWTTGTAGSGGGGYVIDDCPSSSSQSSSSSSSSLSSESSSSSSLSSESSSSSSSSSESSSSSSSLSSESSSSSSLSSESSSSSSLSSESSSSSSSSSQLFNGWTWGEQFPVGTTAEEWTSWKYLESPIEATNTGDWGNMELECWESFVSPVMDSGGSRPKMVDVSYDDYSVGQGSGTIMWRGSNTPFAQDDVLPAWIVYTVPVQTTFRYIQIRTNG